MTSQVQQFASDNYAGICPEVWEAMALATRILFLTRSPGRAALDWRPDLPPPGERGAAEIEAAVTALRLRHPRLLEGEAGS